jgi:N-acetylneuraminic acid mutarotase
VVRLAPEPYGVGRASSQDRVTRFNDMWQFDGTNWTEIKPAHVPPARYGAQVAVDPRNGNVLLFGGLRVDTVSSTDANGKPTTTQVQVYSDDFWQWDGKDWTQVTYGRIPPARENGAMAWDPSLGTFVIFGGYAGQQFLSDLWILQSDNTWQPLVTSVVKRRSAR